MTDEPPVRFELDEPDDADMNVLHLTATAATRPEGGDPFRTSREVIARRAVATLLDGVPALLRGERTRLVRFFHPDDELVARPADGTGAVRLEIRGEDGAVVDGSFVLARDALVAELVRFGEACDDRWIDRSNPSRVQWQVHQSLLDARQLLEHYRERGSLDGFERTRTREQVATHLFDGDLEDERMTEYVLEHDAVEPAIVRLQEHATDEAFREKIGELLLSYDRLCERALQALQAHPDERAADAIRAPLWSGDPGLEVEAARAPGAVGGDEAPGELAAKVDDAAEPRVAVAAVEALGRIGTDDATAALETVVEGDHPDEVRRAARDALGDRHDG